MMQENQKTRKTRISYPLRYEGNLFILIVLLIIWPPLGLILWVKNGSLIKAHSRFFIDYHGHYFWLFFWAILFFPIAIVLFLLNGADWVEETQLHE